MKLYKITAAQAATYAAHYVGARTMLEQGISRSEAYRIMASCPSAIRISIDGTKPFTAIPVEQYRLIRATKRPRGNPLMHKSSFQRRMVLRRRNKTNP